MQPFFIMLVGLPGSGKTTLRNEIQKAFDVAVLSTDDTLEDVANARNETYTEVFDKFINFAQQEMKDKFISYKANLWNIIHDQTNLTCAKRLRVIDSLPIEYKKICIVVECSAPLLSKRLSGRPGKVIPATVIDTMIKSYQHPVYEEGWDIILKHESEKDV